MAGGGPLRGVEQSIPLGLGHALMVFAWLAGPVAFPIIALAIRHFPSLSPLLRRHRALYVVPYLAAAPMLALGAATSLYLVGVESMRQTALWDAAHPAAHFGSFALALGINVFALIGIPSALDHAVMRALALDAEQRPASAQAFGTDLLGSLAALA